jgi:hypothetical protein
MHAHAADRAWSLVMVLAVNMAFPRKRFVHVFTSRLRGNQRKGAFVNRFRDHSSTTSSDASQVGESNGSHALSSNAGATRPSLSRISCLAAVALVISCARRRPSSRSSAQAPSRYSGS